MKPSAPVTSPLLAPAEAKKAIEKLTIQELANKPVAEQIELLAAVSNEVKTITLIEEAVRTPEQKLALKKAQELCNKLYKSIPLDPKFKEKDLEQRKVYLDNLSKNKSLQDLSNPKFWDIQSSEYKVQEMQKAIDAQYDVICKGSKKGVPEIKIKNWPQDATKEQKESAIKSKTKPQGNYNPNDHTITFWVYNKNKSPSVKEEGPLRDFNEALDTAIHETSHAYQHELIDRLNAGELKKGDWEYEQAMLFKLNNDAYENSGGDFDAYKNEPMEKHAWLAGNTAALLFNIDAQSLDLKKNLDNVAVQYPDQAEALTKAWKVFSNSGSSNVAERGDAFLKLKLQVSELAAKAQEAKSKEENAFTKELTETEKIVVEINAITFYTHSPLTVTRDKLFADKSKIINDWNGGPIATIGQCKTRMQAVKTELIKLKPVAAAYQECENATTELTAAFNKLGTTLATPVYAVYTELQTQQSQFAKQRDDAAKSLDIEGIQNAKGAFTKLQAKATQLKTLATEYAACKELRNEAVNALNMAAQKKLPAPKIAQHADQQGQISKITPMLDKVVTDMNLPELKKLKVELQGVLNIAKGLAGIV